MASVSADEKPAGLLMLASEFAELLLVIASRITGPQIGSLMCMLKSD